MAIYEEFIKNAFQHYDEAEEKHSIWSFPFVSSFRGRLDALCATAEANCGLKIRALQCSAAFPTIVNYGWTALREEADVKLP